MRWLALLFWITSASAQAPSFLGLCHDTWNCKATERLYNKRSEIIISYLEHTFGESCKCVDRLLESPKSKVVRVHIANSVCMRNKRCGEYEVFWGYTVRAASKAIQQKGSRAQRRFLKVLKRLHKRLRDVKDLTCFVSPCLECDLDERARRFMGSLVSSVMPYCNFVDNPFRRRCLRGVICEKHGENPGLIEPCIIDLDGIDGRTVDMTKWVEYGTKCDLQFYWEPWMNCIRGEFVDPRKRDCFYKYSTFSRTQRILCQYFSPSSDIC